MNTASKLSEHCHVGSILSPSISATVLDSYEQPLRHPELSFDDGTVAVCTTQFYFLVHQGLLCRHSQFFSDIFQRLNGENVRILSGRPALQLQESTDDMLYFLRAIYDGIAFLRYDADSFKQVASILRLATRYRADRLRTAILEQMTIAWPNTLQKWEQRELMATDDAGLYSPRPIYPHPILVIQLAREVDAPQLLPSAFYDLSRYLPSQMVAGYTSTDMTAYGLSNEDILVTLKGKESAARFLSTFIVSELEGREVSRWCSNLSEKNAEKNIEKQRACRIAFEAITFELLRDMNGLVCNRNSDPLHAITESHNMQTRNDVPGADNNHIHRACEACRLELAAAVAVARADFWMKLPTWFEVAVPTWGSE